MNRRNFFKVITGFVAGVFALPSKTIGRKRSGTRLATKDEIEDFDFTPSYYMPCPDKNGNLTDNWVQLPPDGNWTHIVICSPDNEPTSLKVYLDGKEVV